jgi:4-hydroxybenzoate polyprenyltransferase
MTVAPAASPVHHLRTYASFVRFEHTLFSLPLILAGIYSAPGPAIRPSRWALIAIAAVAARTTAMALNRLIDRRLDALNPRTRVRELPAGRMKLPEAIALLVASAFVYLTACAALGRWYLEVAAIPLVVFAGYPYMKRFTPFCHFGVGAGLGLAPLAGYAAAHPGLERWLPSVLLAAFAFLWVSGFDVIYATLDEAFDRDHGVHSMVAWLGRERALRVSWVLHLAAAAALLATGLVIIGSTAARATDWGIFSGLLFAVALGLLYLEQRWAEDVNLAFFKINVWVGVVVLAMVLAARMAGGGF